MHPGDVRAAPVDAHAGLLEPLDAARDVLTLEADEIDALAVLGQEAADRLVRIGRLQELDVADARRQDRILEAELLRLAAVMHRQAEEAREALDRGLDVTHHDGQLDDVTQHGRPPGSSARLDCSPRAWRPRAPGPTLRLARRPRDGLPRAQRADHTVESPGSHAPAPRIAILRADLLSLD